MSAQVRARVSRWFGSVPAARRVRGWIDFSADGTPVTASEDLRELVASFAESRQRSKEAEAQIRAVDRAQAMIEFRLDGTIVHANDNFLKATGYAREEIIGQKHRMFCHADYAASAEYGEFWQRLRTGEPFVGTYRRRRKDGSDLWIQGSYNPLIDASGQVYGVIKVVSDVTAQVQSRSALEALVSEASMVLGAVARGDLSHRVRGSYDGALGALTRDINQAIGRLSTTLDVVEQASGSVASAVQQIRVGSDHLANRSASQASALEETTASLEELTSFVQRNAASAKAADEVGRGAREAADRGEAVTQRALVAMTEIKEHGRRIGEITAMINGIAFQTNLLALNAAVEAARAGDHGRGFAVVASEVRELALRSSTAAREITTLITDTLDRVGEGHRLVEESADALGEIVTAVQQVSVLVAQVSSATAEQAGSIHQVNHTMSQIDDSTQGNATLVEELGAAGRSLEAQTERLQRELSGFVLHDGNARHRQPRRAA